MALSLTEMALIDIETNESIKEYLFLTLSTAPVSGYRFSKTAMLRMETLSHVTLQIKTEASSVDDVLKQKRETLAAFLYRHPWIKVDTQYPCNQLTPILKMFNDTSLTRTGRYLAITPEGNLCEIEE